MSDGGHVDANTEENLIAAVDAIGRSILTDAVGEQEAREKAGRAETARVATRWLHEVIRWGVVIQREAVAAAGEAAADATGAEPLEEQEKLYPTPELIAAGMQEANRRAIERGELEDCGHNGMHAVWKCRTCCEIGTYACPDLLDGDGSRFASLRSVSQDTGNNSAKDAIGASREGIAPGGFG